MPRDISREAPWPVILALHGGGSYGSDGLRQTVAGLAAAIRNHSERFPAVVVFPQAPADGTPGWHGSAGRASLAAIEAAIREFNGDDSRVYLTGLSAGGNGAWYLASRYPERFAAAVIVCGWITERLGTTSGVPYPSIAPAAATDPFAAVAQQVAALPLWIFHGDADRTVPVEESRRMAAALEAIGAEVNYTELPGVGHNAWDPAYEREDLMPWLLEHQRQ